MSADCTDIASSDTALTALGVSGAPGSHGVVKITANDNDATAGNASNASASAISLVLNDAAQGIFGTANSGVGSSTGKFLQWRNYDNHYVFDVQANGSTDIWSPDGTAQAMLDITSTSSLPYLFISTPGAAARGNILSVLASGNIGIGTTTPATRFDVNGALLAEATSDPVTSYNGAFWYSSPKV